MNTRYLDEAILSIELLIATDNTGDHDLPTKEACILNEVLDRLKIYRNENAKEDDNGLDTGLDSRATTDK